MTNLLPVLASAIPLTYLVLDPKGPETQLALFGLLVTTVGGLLGNWLEGRRAEKRHQWEMEERRSLAAKLDENTALTRITAHEVTTKL